MIQALERLSRSEEVALLELVRANNLNESRLACRVTRQQASGRGRHVDNGGLSGQTFSVSYNLLLCEFCGNLVPSRCCPAKVRELRQQLQLGE